MDVNPRGSAASAILCPMAMSCDRWLYPGTLHVSFGPLPMRRNQVPLLYIPWLVADLSQSHALGAHGPLPLSLRRSLLDHHGRGALFRHLKYVRRLTP